jgi:hypothetical protein
MAIENITTNLGSLWMGAFPGSWGPKIGVGTAAFFMLFILFRDTLLLACLEKSASDVENIYCYTYGDDPLKSDAEFQRDYLSMCCSPPNFASSTALT